MTSKLVVNTIEADTGISSVSFASSISLNSGSKFHFSNAGIDIGADTNINRPAAGVLGFNINSSEKVRVTSSGYIGIGTDNPQKEVDILDASNSQDVRIWSKGDQTSSRLILRTGNNGNSFVLFGDTADEDIGAIRYVHHSDENSMRFITNTEERLRITSDGKIGINESSPTSVLHVSDTEASGGVTLTLTNIGDGGSSTTPFCSIDAKLNTIRNGGQIRFGREGVYGDQASADSFMAFYTAQNDTNNERLRISSNGATKVCHNGGAFGVGGDPINKFGITASDNNFFGLHRSNASTGTGEFNINIEANSQVTFSMDDEGAFSFGTSTDPSAQSGYSEKLRIGSNGSVGIGTDYLSTNATTYHKLMVEGDTTSTIAVAKIVRKNSSASNNTYTFEVDSSSHTSNMTNGGAMSVDVNSGRAFTINGNGDALIGTTTSAGKLTVDSGASNTCATFQSSDAGAGINLKDDSARSSLEQNGTTLKIVSDTGAEHANSDIRLQVDGSTKLAITSEGKVVVGGGTGTGYPCKLQSHGPGNLLDLNSTSGAAKILFYESGTGRFNIETLNGSSGLRFYDSLNSAERFKINSDGHLFAPSLNSGSGHNDVRWVSSTGQFIYNSSTRLIKTDIEDCSYGLAEIKQLKPRIYKRIDADNVVEIGLIADEVQPILPEIVVTEKKSFFTKNESDTEIIPSNWDSKCLTAILIKAIQEQQEQIETLKSKVAALEGS